MGLNHVYQASRATRGLEPLAGCSRRLFADFLRIASLLLLKLHKQLSSERLALLGTWQKYSVRNVLGVLGGPEVMQQIRALYEPSGGSEGNWWSKRGGGAGEETKKL